MAWLVITENASPGQMVPNGGGDKLRDLSNSQRDWSLGWVSAVDCEGRTIWIVDAHRDGKRFVVRADEKLTAFLELEWTALGLGRSVSGEPQHKK